MAYDANLDEEDENQDEGGDSAAKTLGPESGVFTGQENKPSGQSEGSGQYTNLQGYLDQPNVGGFGEQFSGRVGESVTNAQNQQASANQAFRQKADEGTVRTDENLLNTATQSPEQVINDQEKLQGFRKMQHAQYGGPEQFSGTDEFYSPAYQATNKAKEETELAGTDSGKKTLLDSYYGAGAGRGGYTGGQKNLDQILLGMNPGTRNALEAQQNQAKQAQSNFGLLENELNQYGQSAKSATADTAKRTNEALSGALTRQQQEIQDKYNKENSAYQSGSSALQAGLKNKSLTAEQMSKYGITPGQKTFNLDPSSSRYYKAGVGPDINSVASVGEAAKIKAFYDLAEQNNTFLTDPSRAGTYDPNKAYGFDTGIFNEDVASAQANYNDQLNNRQYRFMPGAPGSTTEGVGFSGGVGDYGIGGIAGRGENGVVSLAEALQNIQDNKANEFSSHGTHTANAAADWQRKGGATSEQKYQALLEELQNRTGYRNSFT